MEYYDWLLCVAGGGCIALSHWRADRRSSWFVALAGVVCFVAASIDPPCIMHHQPMVDRIRGVGLSAEMIAIEREIERLKGERDGTLQ